MLSICTGNKQNIVKGTGENQAVQEDFRENLGGNNVVEREHLTCRFKLLISLC